MTPLFKKLNYSDQKEALIINAPDALQEEWNVLSKTAKIYSDVAQIQKVSFAMAFVMTKEEIAEIGAALYSKLDGDPIVWFCYPKKSSKKYSVSIHRDSGWEGMGPLNMEPVKAVSIDMDWSGLRFRKVDYIQSMKRSDKMILSKAGRDLKRKSS